MVPEPGERETMHQKGEHGKAELAIRNEIAEFRFTNPDNFNCVTYELTDDMTELVHAAHEHRDEFSAILWTAEGEAFCSGLHTDIFAERDEDSESMRGAMNPTYRWMSGIDVPVIAAARKYAIGAGASFLCYLSDIQVVTPDLEFWFPEIRHGTVPGERAAYLAGQIGRPVTTELMLLGEEGKVTGKRGYELGLFSRLAEDDTLEAEARDIAETIVEYENRNSGIVGDFMDVIYDARDEVAGNSISSFGRDPIEPSL